MTSASTKTPKKRKHATFRDENSSHSTTPIRVEVTPNNPSHDPIVVSFPRGVPTSLLSHDKQPDPNNNSNNATRLPRFTWSKLKSSSDRGRRITGSDDTCTYSGASSGRGHDGRLTKLYVAVLDKTNRTLRLVPAAERGTTFALDQTVEAYVPNVSAESMAAGGRNDESNRASATDRVRMLVDSFGSKKKQKVMASRAANVVNINQVVGAGNAMMDSVAGQGGAISEANREMMTDGSKVVNTVEAALLQARRQVLPPFDEKGTAPNKVYNPQVMAGSTAWVQVSRIVDKVIKRAQEEGSREWIEPLLGKGKPNAFVPESIKQLLQTLDPLNKKGHIFRAKTAFFLFLVLRFHRKISGRGRILGDYDECISQTRAPADVGIRLLELFTSPIEAREESGYVCSNRHLDKLHAYILVLYVIASGNDMKAPSVNQLCKDIKMEEKKAALIYREAGFTVKKSSVGDVGVSLSVPLTFPPPKRGKK